jgi:hypothetical protein
LFFFVVFLLVFFFSTPCFFLSALEVNQTVQELRLSHNAIGAGGMRALGRSVSSCRSLQVLDVASNAVRAAGLADFHQVGGSEEMKEKKEKRERERN